MTTDADRFSCLLDELETSHKLIRSGFGCLQEIDMENDFYHLPHLLLASGLERLMKCYISLVFQGRNGSYPDMAFMKELGHDLVRLRDTICEAYYAGLSLPLVRQELTYITNDRVLNECLRILSLFGMFGRYYNLDVIAGSPRSPIDPTEEWQALEGSIEDIAPFLNEPEALYRDYYPRVHAQIIAKLERFIRAIALQFTVGEHPDRSGNLRSTSTVYSDFRNLKDEDFGTTDYRQSVRILRKAKKEWIKRTDNDILTGSWPTRIVEQGTFPAEWPFRCDRVILELRDKIFAMVYIDGYAFALNGAAATRFNVPFPHDAGLAVLGKSVAPFIDMALSLREDDQ